jgi:hypothetical protein
MLKRILLLSMFVLAACSSIQPPPPDSGIEGTVLIGPMCPVMREGEECPDQPYQAVLTVTSPKGERIVQVQTEADGRFRIPLPPGEYILHPESPNILPFAQEQSFVVMESEFIRVDVKYDSGIR